MTTRQNRHTRPRDCSRCDFTVMTLPAITISQDGPIGETRRTGTFQTGIQG